MKNQFFFFTFIFSLTLCAQKIPNGFVYLSNIDITIKAELRYLGNHNFIGKTIDGYYDNCVIVTKETANALHKVQTILEKKGLSLKIFDAYRPQQSVNHFGKWARVLSDTLMKTEYYPKVPKSELFKRGYIASKSGHSRGSTIDLTIVNLTTGKELDMGSPYDFFGIESHPFHKNINEHQQKNRLYLRKIMLENNFKPYENEWWHFTLKNEPFPKTYFNFPIKK
ncbi:MAG: M15 family metallopeptidase [Polaribacter sp.]|uniref:M15 family metallopeptidase n=1 Tax=Polaribacter sp. TaxID=1920175 RepID=UPI002627FD6C|nr:M15 family metallopeptidase [Polaribacter sp.]MBT3742419.1 M15 family metallopeptidase [Polaribacter sp.]MDG1194547.1 M15 family metallopeptidase [Polaribacter sp.]MDG1402483.1 M15 family metallopeptidase [Polaribacter sp.]